ncbi:MAG: osmotically inducible protein OsmC [Candidatus Phytoplasma sp.]|nr:osmotically inducible protein OsmC [Phytoplasma sp.]
MSIYKGIAYNKNGTNGLAYTKDGLSVNLTPINSNGGGTNPEELLALSWAACLNSTAKSILRLKNIDTESLVKVEVDIDRVEKKGLIFIPKAYLAVKGMNLEDTLDILNIAHKNCPVSKLLKSNEETAVFPVLYDDLIKEFV